MSLCQFFHDLACCLEAPARGRIVPVIGLVREQTAAVAPTPQYKGWPLVGETLMALSMTDNQYVTLTPVFVGKKGNPGVVDGIPVWLVDNPNVLALEPAADGKSCKVSSVGPLGSAKVSLTADADLGEGVKEIAGTFDFDIVASAAVTVELKADSPQEQP